ncbi:MAG TPA: putative zinc-binding peptidase [Vicinamibacterales bacterium]|nr:putative zinc-binding peptidase [Vicinamibacterales bacterium]
MRVFHCDHCSHLLFFENTHCVACGHQVAYLPDLGLVGSLDPTGDGRWRSPLPRASGAYRLCRNYEYEQVCNWAVPAEDANALCQSCRLTHVIPNLAVPGHREAWYRLEVAKRRLVVTLLALGLPLQSRDQDPDHGLAFEFKTDADDPLAPRVLTGHASGVITVNAAEADDAERERRRTSMYEPYRTLLGHMRHESGHHYWDRLVCNRPPLEGFRRLFGDEQRDYDAALQAYYANGAVPDWQSRFVSAYASAHPWEDWAETWAHYLHMIDTLETAAACGLTLRPRRTDEPSLPHPPSGVPSRTPFDELIASWFPLTYALNSLNRGLGLADAYPFVLSLPAIEKLRFVHQVVIETSRASTDSPEFQSDSPCRA